MAVTEHASGTQACTVTTEHTLTAAPETTAGAYQIFMDFNPAVLLDIFEIRIKEKVLSGGTERVFWFDTLAQLQGEEKIWVSPVFMVLHGWDVSLKQTTGTSRSIPWSIRKA